MLDEVDAIVLADGVRVDGDHVVDDVRARPLPLNTSACFVLTRAGQTLGDVAAELAVAHDIDPGRAREDVLAFAYRLNRLHLVNVDRRQRRSAQFRSWLRNGLRLAPGGGLPGVPWRRVGLDTRSGFRAAGATLVAIRGRAVAASLFASLVAVQTAAIGGVVSGWAPLTVGAGVGLGLAAHEAGHAGALRGVPAALVLAGPRTFVIHGSVADARRRLVAATGPIAPAALGAVVAAAARPAQSVALALGACALGGHGVGLTIATRDGRIACGA